MGLIGAVVNRPTEFDHSQICLSREFPSALEPSACKDVPAVLCLHALTEAVYLFTLPFLRLISLKHTYTSIHYKFIKHMRPVHSAHPTNALLCILLHLADTALYRNASAHVKLFLCRMGRFEPFENSFYHIFCICAKSFVFFEAVST